MTFSEPGSSVVGHLRRSVVGASGRARALIAFAAGSASVLAMAPFHVAPVLLLTLPVLVWLIDAQRPDVAPRGGSLARRLWPPAVTGWWFGFGYFLFGMFWIGEAFLVEAEKYAFLIPFAVTLLPAGLAVFFGVAVAAASLAWPRGLSRVLVLAVALAVAEWLRGNILTGLPWNTLGYALTWPLPLMQAASLVGVYGLTLWTVLLAAAPLVVAADADEGEHASQLAALAGAGLAVAGLSLAALWGWSVLAKGPAAPVAGVALRLVQPSVPQREKWRPEKQGEIFRLHLDLSRRDGQGNEDGLVGTTHVVWPEAAMPFLPLEHPEAVSAIADMLPERAVLLSGALRRVLPNAADAADAADGAAAAASRRAADRRVYNSLMVFGRGGLLTVYDKTHLVPFGEYLPMSGFWRWFGLGGLAEKRGQLTAGARPRPLLDVAGLPKLGALICYEAIFPGRVIEGPDRPGLLLSVTNDGWFGNTTGPRQHFHQARVRAVEEGLPMVRAANNGISAVIDAEGRVVGRLDLDVRGVLDAPLPGGRPPTLYAKIGDLALLAMSLIFLVVGWFLRTPRNNKERPSFG